MLTDFTSYYYKILSLKKQTGYGRRADCFCLDLYALIFRLGSCTIELSDRAPVAYGPGAYFFLRDGMSFKAPLQESEVHQFVSQFFLLHHIQ